MIRKSVARFSEKIMPQPESQNCKSLPARADRDQQKG